MEGNNILRDEITSLIDDVKSVVKHCASMPRDDNPDTGYAYTTIESLLEDCVNTMNKILYHWDNWFAAPEPADESGDSEKLDAIMNTSDKSALANIAQAVSRRF